MKGQVAFLAKGIDRPTTSHVTAAYMIDTDGTVRLLVKEGMSTALGTIYQVGQTFGGGEHGNGIALNSKGQIALTVRFANSAGGGGPETLVLLTPAGP